MNEKFINQFFLTSKADFVLYNKDNLIDNCQQSFYDAMAKIGVVVDKSCLRVISDFPPISVANIVLSSFSKNGTEIIIPINKKVGYLGVRYMDGEIFYQQYKLEKEGGIIRDTHYSYNDILRILHTNGLTFEW